jgi:hypothetical protein
MTTETEAFENIVGINFADAVLNELRCGRRVLADIETEDKELTKTLDHLARHIDAAGALSFLMKNIYGNRAKQEVDLHKEALKEFDGSRLVHDMKAALDAGAEDTDLALRDLLKALGISV